jgi:hypothetical protein
VETDICIHCGKPIYWGSRKEPTKVYDPAYTGGWKLRYWRHEKTQISACNWTVPIKFAQPKSGQLSKDQDDFQKHNQKGG